MTHAPTKFAPQIKSFVRRCAVMAMFVTLTSCDRKQTGEKTSPSSNPASDRISPTVASLVPAATDLIVGMNAANHLIAISNWDAPSTATTGLPHVGDYRDVDWERIAQLHPEKMIVQFAPQKMPAGLERRCSDLHVGLINVRLNRLEDVFESLTQLGTELHESDKATSARDALNAQLDAVRKRVANAPPTSTLIVRSEGSANIPCVGRASFLDDVLIVAGGKNVLADLGNPYPTIDEEQLISLDPEAIFVLLPGEPEQVVERAHSFWESHSSLRATRSKRVFFLTDSFLLLPGLSVGKIAEEFADRLHPLPTTTAPTTKPVGRA